MQTYSGIAFDFQNPDPAKILIEDIAHALSLICRYGGHTKRFYSVAEHSIIISQLSKYSLEGLLHDAAEAYLGDMIYPIKHILPDYKVLEDNLLKVIAQKYGLIYPFPAEITNLDYRMLGVEREQAMVLCEKEWFHVGKVIPYLKLEFLSSQEAENRFIKRFNFLKELKNVSD